MNAISYISIDNEFKTFAEQNQRVEPVFECKTPECNENFTYVTALEKVKTYSRSQVLGSGC